MTAPVPSAASPLTIRARAPLRIDLGGIDTDLGGPIVVGALSLAAHVDVWLGGRTIRLRAPDRDQHVTLTSAAELVYDGRLDRAKAALNMLPVTGGIEVLTQVDAPEGAGLGAPAALNVALLAALARCRRERYDAAELAELAWTLETAELGLRLGRQDAVVAALGGIHLVHRTDTGVEARALRIPPDQAGDLASHLVVAYLGRAYVSGIAAPAVNAAWADGNGVVTESLCVLRDVAAEVMAALEAGDWAHLGRLFDTSWREQQQLDPALLAPPARALEEAARSAGAWALRATTARSGGSVLILCPPAARDRVAEVVQARGGVVLACAFASAGVHTWIEGGDEEERERWSG